MPANFKRASQLLAVIAGFAGFFLMSGLSPFIISIPFCLFLFRTGIKKKKDEISFFLFFSSGLLLLIMKLFFWDRRDFEIRSGILFLLSVIFSIILFFIKNNILKKVSNHFSSLELKKRLVLIFFVCEIIFIFSAWINVGEGVVLVGDEPHYLVISQSIAQDFDLNVFNQYARDKYRDFIDYRLAHHSKVGKGFKRWYSFHLPGLSSTLIPFFLIKIPPQLLYFLIRSFLGLFGAGIAVMVYILSLNIWRKKNLSLFITVSYIFSSPLFFYSFHIFSEAQVILLLLLSLYFGLFLKKRRINSFWSGFFLGITVFWGMKYLIFIFVYSALFIIRAVKERQLARSLAFFTPVAIFVLLFFCYLNFAYGNFSPMSVYTGVISSGELNDYYQGVKNITLKSRIETLLDYFFDQRDGLLLYSPLYFFAFPGILLAFRKFRENINYFLIALAPLIYILYHGYSTVRPGFSPQARYLVPVTWILMLFVVYYYINGKNKIMKDLLEILPVYSFLVVIFQVANPFTLYQTTTHNYLDRAGLMFQKLSNIYVDLTRFLPSFIKVNGNETYLPNIVFMIIVIALIIFCFKRREKGINLIILPLLFLFLFVQLALFPRVSIYNPVKVKTETGAAFLLHGNRYPKTDVVGAAVTEFLNRKRIMISTVRPFKRIKFLIEGKYRVSPGSSISHSDGKHLREVHRSSKSIQMISDYPVNTKFRGRLYYSFFVNSSDDPSNPVTVRIDPE